MADSASTELKVRLMEDGVTSSWGDKVDTNMQIIEHALTGSATASLAGGDWTLSDADYTEDEGKASILIATGSLGANRNIVIPNKKKYWVVKNDTSGAYTVTVKTSSGTGKTVTQSTVATFWCDGADAVYHVSPMVNPTTGAPSSASGAAASSVSFTPTGSISSTNVQAALAEVDGDVTALSASLPTTYQPLDSDLTIIAGLSAADGNFVVGNGSTWTVESGATARASLGVVIGSDVQAYDAFLADIAALTDPGADRLLFWDDSVGDIGWLTASDGIVLSGTSMSSRLVQTAYDQETAYSSYTSVIPPDNSIPQSSEGTEILRILYTPKSASNILVFDVVVPCSTPTAISAVASLCVSTGTDAIAMGVYYPVGTGAFGSINFRHVASAGSTSARTYSVNFGPGVSGTVYLNGTSSARVGGGISRALLTIQEYIPN